MEHKIARSVIDWAQERNVGMLAIGNVRNIADGKRLNKKSQQKISNWSHGTVRKYIEYKAKHAGISVDSKVSERYTSQTCPNCGNRKKPNGRTYKCSSCGEVYHRDVVGASNILSMFLEGECGHIPAPKPKYRYPFLTGKRSPSGTGQVARLGENR